MESEIKEADQKPSSSVVTPESVTRIRDNMIRSKLKKEDGLGQTSTLSEVVSNEVGQGRQRRESMGSDLTGWKWLADLSPGFAFNGSQIKVLKDPSEFYSTLIEKLNVSTKRVSLASLYLGTGELERKFVETLQTQMSKNPEIRIKVLLDYARGSRGLENNSRQMLLPLMQDASNDNCQVFLYHTPALRGLIKKWLPPRWNEIVGLQHMKIYIFDNDIVISGANLSNDYFTNRQDRYFLIENAHELANFFDGLISEVAKFSFKLDSTNQTQLDSEWAIHPSDDNAEEFVSKAKSRIIRHYENTQANNSRILKEFYGKNSSGKNENGKVIDTWIFPLIQMGQLDVKIDDEATSKLLAEAPENSTIKLATGYFNLTSDYIDKIINKSSANYHILMAHPEANGFFGATGVSHGIPAAYTLLATKFFDTVKSTNQIKRISMWEYLRKSWTFHAKGLWYYPPGEQLPQVTLIGSPNFGHRSVYRDLELQLYVVTKNNGLRLELENEQKVLFGESKPFNDFVISQRDRTVPTWVRLVIRFFRNLF